MEKRVTPTATDLLKDLSDESLVELYPVFSIEEIRKERGKLVDLQTSSCSDSCPYAGGS